MIFSRTDGFAKGYYLRKALITMDVSQLLEENARRFSQKTAVIFKERSLNFFQLKEETLKLAWALLRLGVKPGEKVAIYLPNCPEYVFSYLAVFSIGAVGVPLDFMLKTDELVSCLEHSETRVLIALSKPDISFEKIKSLLPNLTQIFTVNSEVYQQIMSHSPLPLPKRTIDESAPALIMYTSGTTGRPKGILLTYRHLNGSPQAMKHFVDLSDKDIKLAAIPFSHIAGLIYVQNCLVFGITLIIMERFHPVEFLRSIEQYKVTCFHIVPAMYTAILSL